jgi:hypothetical protein
MKERGKKRMGERKAIKIKKNNEKGRRRKKIIKIFFKEKQGRDKI